MVHSWLQAHVAAGRKGKSYGMLPFGLVQAYRWGGVCAAMGPRLTGGGGIGAGAAQPPSHCAVWQPIPPPDRFATTC